MVVLSTMNLGRGLALVAIASTTGHAGTAPGFTAAVGAGLNVRTPFVELRLGRRFARARHFELFLDYSYNKAISAFSFQTGGVGVRTYLTHVYGLELFHQAVAAFAISSSGTTEAPHRTIGDRLLGPVFTQGLGLEAGINCRWSTALVFSIGDPVWFRPELTVKITF